VTQKELLEAVLTELALIKKDLPNGQFKQLMETVKDMKEDISDLKFTLLNPEDGVIVKTNRSLDISKELEEEFHIFEEKIIEIKELIRWKNAVNKALWILFGTLAAVIVQLIFMSNAI